MTRFVAVFSSRMMATASLMLICVAARAASPHRYEVSVDDSLDRLAVHACFDGKAPDALVAESNGARFYLESMRLGERLLLTTNIEPAALSFYLPAFTLQPIVENAVKHAIAPRAGGGRLCITANTEGNDILLIKVSDDGTGNSSKNGETTSGLGLRLVRESLAARYGGAAILTVEAEPNIGFTVSIKIPRTADTLPKL